MSEITKKLGIALVCAAFLLIPLVYWSFQAGQVIRILCCVLIALYMANAIDYCMYLWKQEEEK